MQGKIKITEIKSKMKVTEIKPSAKKPISLEEEIAPPQIPRTSRSPDASPSLEMRHGQQAQTSQTEMPRPIVRAVTPEEEAPKYSLLNPNNPEAIGRKYQATTTQTAPVLTREVSVLNDRQPLAGQQGQASFRGQLASQGEKKYEVKREDSKQRRRMPWE